jgi:hypothetical protein
MLKIFTRNKKVTQVAQTLKNVISPPKIATVEEIHAEFDSAESRILDQCNTILAELQIPTETQIEKKAKLLQQLGFENSETVKQASVLKERTREIETKIHLTKQQADLIRSYKVKYPLEKFITVEELERICNKYNLIHAPVKNYIKDIPEKNVLEMANCRKLDEYDKKEKSILITNFEFWKDASQEYRNFIKNNVLDKEFIINSSILEYESYFSEFITKLGFAGNKGSEYWFCKINGNSIDKSGLFIAAPSSHFNLDGLDKKSQYGYFNVEKYEVKDPVVFEYCKNNICRIVTKWGTEDDQAYLDPLLTNEIEN